MQCCATCQNVVGRGNLEQNLCSRTAVYAAVKKKIPDFGNYAHTVGTLIVDRGHKESWSYLSSALQPKLDNEAGQEN